MKPALARIYLSTFIRNDTSACTSTLRTERGYVLCIRWGFWLADRLPYICSREERKIRELILFPRCPVAEREKEDEVEVRPGARSVSILFRSH